MEQILIIDDDVELCELVVEYLAAEGFVVEVAHNGEEGVPRVLTTGPALVVLDVMLPGLGGFEILRRIRAARGAVARTPVLMLTARGDEVDRIVGLELGADDYLPKPFNPRELVARINAILRRARPGDDAAAPVRQSVGDLELDAAAREVRLRGEPVELTTAEFDLVSVLLSAAGHVVTRETIAKAVFDRKMLPYDRSIDMHISNLRRKLGEHGDGTERIKTVRGAGYIYTLTIVD